MYDNDAEILDVVLWRAGGCWFGCEAGCVIAAEKPEDSPTVDEFPHIETLLNIPAVDGRTDFQLLTFRYATTSRYILVNRPVELIRLPIGQIRALPTLVAARSRIKALGALALAPQGLIFLLNTRLF